MDASSLLDAMNRAEVTSEQAVLVYTERAYHIGCKEINAVTESFFLEALQAAKWSDLRRRESHAVRPLEGLPISIKDCFDMQGSFSTVGITSRTVTPGKHDMEDGLMLKILKEAGAIPIIKTNVPQGLLHDDTFNNLFGATLNPFDCTRGAGGSSGGESAAVSAQCVPLGFGTDIGGSVRGPSACCGLYGFKCTERRLSTKGLAMQEGPGQESILSMPGPIARSADDCVLAVKAWLCQAMFRGDEAYTVPIPFDEGKYYSRSPLKVAVLTQTDLSGLMCAASQRAVSEAAEAFKALGADVVFWDLRLDIFRELERVWIDAIITADEVKWLIDALDGEEACVPSLNIIPALRALNGAPDRSFINKVQHRQRHLRDEVTSYFDKHGIDVLLCPALRMPPGQSQSNIGVYFTQWVNVIGFPAGVVPVTTVRPGETILPDSLKTTASRKKRADAMEAAMVGSEGMPMNVQLVGRKWQDETVLRAMKLLQGAFPITFPESTVSGQPSLRGARARSKL